MAFVQTIEFHTSKPDEMRKVADEWEKATEGKRKAGRHVLCQDRDQPGRYSTSCSSTPTRRPCRTPRWP